MFRSLGRMPWSLAWLVFSSAAFGSSPSSEQLQTWPRPNDDTDFATRRHRAVAKIQTLGGKFKFDEPRPLQLDVPPVAFGLANETIPADVPLPDPPPELPADEVLPKENAPAPAAVGLIADAYVSPLIAQPGQQNELATSLSIDRKWRGGDSALAALRDIPDLLSLRLHHAPLSDSALAHIAACQQIKSLDISGVPFTAEALARFRTQRPDIRITGR